MEEHIEEWLSGEGETPGDNPAQAIIADDVNEERESSSTEYDRASNDEPKDSVPHGLLFLVLNRAVSFFHQGTSGLKAPSSGLTHLATACV
jgi:hypothetical protein